MRRPRLRLLASSGLAAALLVAAAGPAAADPPGPTDYRSEVERLDPPTDAVDVRFLGGDSFVELHVHAGHDVVVIGYRGEPYLRFDGDGSVFENVRSPTRAQNRDRYGRVELPPNADPDATPDWRRVGGGGRYAWHDHRTHWMSPARPPGAHAGDQILEAVVPLRVDGEDVDVVVASFLLAPPAGWTRWALLAVGLAGAALVVRWRRFRGVVVGGVAAIALVLGAIAYLSLPATTGPPPWLWMMPLVACLSVATGAALDRRAGGDARRWRWSAALLALAGGELALWAWLRRLALSRALIPTQAPAIVDRTVIAAAAGVGLAVVVVSMVQLLRQGQAVSDPAGP